MQVSGGSAGVLAAMKAGSDLPTLSLPHLSPLPVTVPTHSLNFEQPNLAPNLTFFVVFIFINPLFPTITSSPNPLYRHCSANLAVTYSTPNPFVPFPEGNEGGLASCIEAQLKPQDGLPVAQRSTTQSGSSGPQRVKGWMVRRGTLPNLT